MTLYCRQCRGSIARPTTVYQSKLLEEKNVLLQKRFAWRLEFKIWIVENLEFGWNCFAHWISQCPLKDNVFRERKREICKSFGRLMDAVGWNIVGNIGGNVQASCYGSETDGLEFLRSLESTAHTHCYQKVWYQTESLGRQLLAFTGFHLFFTCFGVLLLDRIQSPKFELRITVDQVQMNINRLEHSGYAPQ